MDFLCEDFKSTVLNVLKDLKEAMGKELKETRRTMSHQIDNINKEIEIIKMKEIEILELKSIKTKMNNSVEGFHSRFNQA